MRTDTRPMTRRSFCLAFFGALFGPLFAHLRHAATRLTSIAGTEIAMLFHLCFRTPQFAGAS